MSHTRSEDLDAQMSPSAVIRVHRAERDAIDADELQRVCLAGAVDVLKSLVEVEFERAMTREATRNIAAARHVGHIFGEGMAHLAPRTCPWHRFEGSPPPSTDGRHEVRLVGGQQLVLERGLAVYLTDPRVVEGRACLGTAH